MEDGAAVEPGAVLLEVNGLPVEEGMALGPGTSTWTFGGAPSGCGITTIGPTRTGPTCTGPTVIGAGSPSVVAGGVEEVVSGAVELRDERGDEFAGGGASKGEVPGGGATSGREAVADGASVRCKVGRSLEGGGGWIGSTVFGEVGEVVRWRDCCRSLLSLGEAVGARGLADFSWSLGAGAATSDDGPIAVALDRGALEAGAPLEEGRGADGTTGGAVDELTAAGGVGTIGAPASGPELELPDGARPAGPSAGSRLFEAAFQGLDEVDGSASWVELPVPANVATPAIPNTANTTVAAITTRTGESARRGGRPEFDKLLAPPLKPRRSSGVAPRPPALSGRLRVPEEPAGPKGSVTGDSGQVLTRALLGQPTSSHGRSVRRPARSSEGSRTSEVSVPSLGPCTRSVRSQVSGSSGRSARQDQALGALPLLLNPGSDRSRVDASAR